MTTFIHTEQGDFELHEEETFMKVRKRLEIALKEMADVEAGEGKDHKMLNNFTFTTGDGGRVVVVPNKVLAISTDE